MTHLFEHGLRKFSRAELIASSASRNWQGVGAELRSHPAGEITPILPTQMEITLAIAGSRTSVVARRAGPTQETVARTGTLWFCPIGLKEDEIRISEPIPEVLHVYLPKERFTELGEGDEGIEVAPDAVAYLADVDDALVRQIGMRLLAELRTETSGGRLLVQSLAQSLALHIGLSYAAAGGAAGRDRKVTGGLDAARLRRVIEFIRANLETDIAVEDLAEVACLSRHHFSRRFQAALGEAPHQYVSRLRLERAKALLAAGDMPVAEIALSCQFSSQSAFGRAFTRSMGVSPAAFRRLNRSAPSYGIVTGNVPGRPA